MQGHEAKGRSGRQRPFEERVNQRESQTAGGRSEWQSRQRDAEQRRAGYSPREWDRREERYRNVHSEPAWDPSYPRDAGVYQRHPDQDIRSERWRTDESDNDYYANEHEYAASPTRRDTWPGERWMREERSAELRRYEPGGFPQGLRPAGVRDWNSERDLARGQHHSALGQRLEDAGRRLVGKVKRMVRNPKNYKRSDERIREDVCDRLSLSQEVDPSDIEVSVDAGEVTLKGSVADRQMKFMAEEIADEVAGVHDVHNQLRVQRAAPTTSNASPGYPEASSPRNIGRS